MKKALLLITLIFAVFCGATAQSTLNDKADNIVGTYVGKQGDDAFKVKIVKLTNGTYRGQVVWLERDKDAKGNKILDAKNPDKTLRSRPADQIVLFSGLSYNSKDRRWDGCKIYDPQRGIRAKLVVCFAADGRLKLRGSLMGISESVYWTKEK